MARRLTSVSTIIIASNETPVDPLLVKQIDRLLCEHFSDVETIFVTNAETSILEMKKLIAEIPDATCIALNERLDVDAARLVGMETAVGDFVLLVTPSPLSVSKLPDLLQQLAIGYDVVLTSTTEGTPRFSRIVERIAYGVLSKLTGAELSPEPIHLALFTREAALYLLSCQNAEILLKARTISPGFATTIISIGSLPSLEQRRPLLQRAGKAVRLLIDMGAAPVRLMGVISIASSLLSLIYAVYVVLVYFLKPDIAHGWTTLSLQTAGMMFLFSIMFWLLSEHVVQIHSVLASRRRRRVIVRELRSEQSHRSERLNVVDERGEHRFGAGLRNLDTGVAISGD
jgi:hypothetical protein